MKKLLAILVLGLLWSNYSFADITTLFCTSKKKDLEYEINERIFDLKKGYYIYIKKTTNNEVEYIINKLGGFSGKFKFQPNGADRIKPFKEKWDKHYTTSDLLLMPIIRWNNVSLAHNSSFYIEEHMDKEIINTCVQKANKNYTKKEYKKIKKKAKSLTAFELIERAANETENKSLEVQKKIFEKELSLNKKVEQKDINHSFSFEDKTGNKISRNQGDSLWKKFWGTVGFVLYEYGDIILDAAIEAKYGSVQQTNTPRMKCVSQRVGSSKMVHTTCRQIN